MQIDIGSTGASGPFIAWSARGTQDGTIPARSFFLRDGSEKTVLDAFTGTGVVMDIDGLKTGWQKSEGIVGVAPEWRWNPSVSQFAASPGEDWKKGISIRCAIGGGSTATWEQAGAATWNAFVGLVPGLQQRPSADVLPLVRMTSTKLQQFKRGSTVEPVLEIVKWVPRPDCLKEGAAAGIALDPAPAAATAPQPAPAAAPAAVAPPAPADMEVEF